MSEPRPYHLDFKNKQQPWPKKKKPPNKGAQFPKKAWEGERCQDFGLGKKKGRYWMKKGKPAYPYLTAIVIARRARMFFYMCPTGDHWHITSTDEHGAFPGKLPRKSSA